MTYANPFVFEATRVPQPEGRWSYIRLDQNENPDGLPQWFFDKTVKKITPQLLSMYPEEQTFIDKYAERMGLDSSNVTMINGSATAMETVFRVFGEKGKKFITVTPTFGLYGLCGKMNGMIPVELPYREDFTFDTEQFIDAIDSDTGIVVLVNPNMPMGNVYEQKDIERIIVKAKENGAMVVVDEAYHYFYKETSKNLVKKYDNLIVLRTFSKMFAMTSLRIGVFISCESNIRLLNNSIPHYTLTSVSILFGETLMDDYDKVLGELTETFEKGREYIYKALDDNGYETIKGHGCFMCIRPKHRPSDYVTEELKKRNILILNGKGYLTGFLRLTICDVKYMELFMNALLDIDKE